MQGRKITWQEAENLRNVQPGNYWFDPRHGWYAACPVPVDDDGLITLLADLSCHHVTENDDGTITVSPSILCRGGSLEYHGWLENGAWRNA
jgi:hypothetical protein